MSIATATGRSSTVKSEDRQMIKRQVPFQTFAVAVLMAGCASPPGSPSMAQSDGTKEIGSNYYCGVRQPGAPGHVLVLPPRLS
jgi:hypothetical protein